MKTRCLTALLWALPAAAGWQPMFNGRDFTGWEQVGKAVWTIEDGAIVARPKPDDYGTGWLVSLKEYSDFRLRLKFRMSPGGNSGIGIRDPSRARGPRTPAHMGYEIAIVDNPRATMQTGSIYALAPAVPGKLKSGEWNEFLITCKGRHIEVQLNGEKVSEIDHDRSLRGVIGFQMHAKDMTVAFKDVEIEGLPAPDPRPPTPGP